MAKKRPSLSSSKTAEMFEPTTAEKASKGKDEKVTLGVQLAADQIYKLDGIATELGASRHQVMQLAIKRYIELYEEGERPKTKTITVLDLE